MSRPSKRLDLEAILSFALSFSIVLEFILSSEWSHCDFCEVLSMPKQVKSHLLRQWIGDDINFTTDGRVIFCQACQKHIKSFNIEVDKKFRKMADKQKEMQSGGEKTSNEKDQPQESYEKKFQEMQKYIPFLEMMILRLERSNDKSREAQLQKMKSLLAILSNTKKKLKIETLQKCEGVLQKLYEKVEKGSNLQLKQTAVKSEDKTTKSKPDKPEENEPKESSSDHQTIISSTDSNNAVANIMKTLVAACKNNKSMLAISPVKDSDVDSNKDDTNSKSTESHEDDIISERSNNNIADVLEKSRERLKKLMDQQKCTAGVKPVIKPLPLEKGTIEEILSNVHSIIGRREVKETKDDSKTKSACDNEVQWHGEKHSDHPIDAGEGRLHLKSGKDAGYLKPDKEVEEPAGWNDSKSPKSVWQPESEQLGSVVSNCGSKPNKQTISPVDMKRVPSSVLSPTSALSQPLFATNSSKHVNTSPTKRSLPNLPSLYNVLQHPPAAGSKPLSDADIEELLEDTNSNGSERKLEEQEKRESTHKRLRAKLEQEIQQVHRVGVSKGGALRGLMQKDEKLKSPIKNRVEILKSGSELSKDKLPLNQLHVPQKPDTGMGSISKPLDNKIKVQDKSLNKQISGNRIPEKGGNKDATEYVQNIPLPKSDKPTDPRRNVSLSPRGEERSLKILREDGERKDTHLKCDTKSDSNYVASNSNIKDFLNEKTPAVSKKEGSGIFPTLSKEEVQKFVEENLSKLPSPPPNTKEILETVNMNSPTTVKPIRPPPTEPMSPLSSPKDFKQLHSNSSSSITHNNSVSIPYKSTVESQYGIGNLPRSSAPHGSSFGNIRTDDRRPLLPTPDLPHDPRTLSRNLNHDPRTGSRENQSPGVTSFPVVNDPRLNSSRHTAAESHRNVILPQHTHDQFLRPVSNVHSQAAHPPFHPPVQANHTTPLQAARWVGTPCYGVLSHNSPRPPDENFVRPVENFVPHGPNSNISPGYQHSSPHPSQHEFMQFQGHLHPMHDQFPGTHQQPPPWQSPPSLHGSSRPMPSPNYSSARPNVQPVQKGPVGDPRLASSSASNTHFSAHRSSIASSLPQQSTNSSNSIPPLHGSSVAGTHTRVEGRSGGTTSERDPRRRSIEEHERRESNSRINRSNRDRDSSRGSRDSSRGSRDSSRGSRDSNRGSRDNRRSSFGSRNSSSGSGRNTDRPSSTERRRETDRQYESSNRRSSPDSDKEKKTELVSPLTSLYGATTIPRTGKGYGLQKFRIPKIKRPPSPPKRNPSPPPESKSPPPKEELTSISAVDSKKNADLPETPILVKAEVAESSCKHGTSDIVSSDDKNKIAENVTVKLENPTPEESVREGDKTNSEARSKEEVTQEWVEALIRKSFESGEGKKIFEQAKLLEKLGDSLKGKKLRRIKKILESDSESGSDDASESCKKGVELKEQKDGLEKENSDASKEEEVSVVQNRKPKYRRVILSDDDQSSDDETLASRLSKKGISITGKTSKDKEKNDSDATEAREEEAKPESEEKSTSSSIESKPVKKYAKRRSALELLQEDIREMFICEGVVTATGHRMCRLLKETPPGMTVDEVSKSAIKRIESEISSAAEESDSSSVISKKQQKHLTKEKYFDKREKSLKSSKKQTKASLKDEKGEETGERDSENALNEPDEDAINSDSINKPESAVDEENYSSFAKSHRKLKKSKWKGSAIKSEEESSDESTVDKTTAKKKSTIDAKEGEFIDPLSQQLDAYYNRRIRPKLSISNTASEESEAPTSNTERGRRTRFPRVVLEKTDISKFGLASSRPRTKYFEDTSSDEEGTVENPSSPLNSKSKFNVVKKSKAKRKRVYRRRGRGRSSVRGRKRSSKRDRNDEASTDVESIVSDHSSITSSMSQQPSWLNTYLPVGFVFRRKGIRKRPKILGKRIDDIISKLSKSSDDFTTVDSKLKDNLSKRNNVDMCLTKTKEEKELEETDNFSNEEKEAGDKTNNSENNDVKKCEEAVHTTNEEKENRNDEHVSDASENTDLVTEDFDDQTKNIGAHKNIQKRNSRIMLNLVRKSSVPKKIKKKKAKWQLGIIHQSKKKSSTKSKIETKTVSDYTCEVKLKEKEDILSNISPSNVESLEVDIKEKDSERLTNQLLYSNDNVNCSDKISPENVETQIEPNEKETNFMNDHTEKNSMYDESAFDLGETAEKNSNSLTFLDHNYILDGRDKYSCKLCPSKCKNIVYHYKQTHPDSEVLISRLSVDESTKAVVEAKASNYRHEEEIKQVSSRRKKQRGHFVCRICNSFAVFAVEFYEHISSHTGEYRFQCSKCSYASCTRVAINQHFKYRHPEFKGFERARATILAPGPANDDKIVFGYLCLLCNYVQLLKRNVEKHIAVRHQSEDNDLIICINMSKVSNMPKDVSDMTQVQKTIDSVAENIVPFTGVNKDLEDANISSPRIHEEKVSVVNTVKSNEQEMGKIEDVDGKSDRSEKIKPVEKSLISEVTPKDMTSPTEKYVELCSSAQENISAEISEKTPIVEDCNIFTQDLSLKQSSNSVSQDSSGIQSNLVSEIGTKSPKYLEEVSAIMKQAQLNEKSFDTQKTCETITASISESSGNELSKNFTTVISDPCKTANDTKEKATVSLLETRNEVKGNEGKIGTSQISEHKNKTSGNVLVPSSSEAQKTRGEVNEVLTTASVILEPSKFGDKVNESVTTSLAVEPLKTGAEIATKEVDLKAFVCSENLEEENSIIQKERLKKMEEIAKNLKDSHPKLLLSNRGSILDQLSNKLKVSSTSKSVDSVVCETTNMPYRVSEEAGATVPLSEEGEERIEKMADVSTLIDEKRAIEAAQAVQNLLRAEKEANIEKHSFSCGRKVVETQSENKTGRETKSSHVNNDTVERRITRSFSRNEEDVYVDIEGSDESSAVSLDGEGEENEESPETEPQASDTLLSEISVLKDSSPKKLDRMFNIIERLASKVIPKTEPIDFNQHSHEINTEHSTNNSVISEAVTNIKNVSSIENDLGSTETQNKSLDKKYLDVIGKPPPVISLSEDREKSILRGVNNEGSLSHVRVGPFEVQRFSDRLLYICSVRQCSYASTNRILFARHIELHTTGRWDGMCKMCNTSVVENSRQSYNLKHALHHLIKFHLVASPDVPSLENTMKEKVSTLSISEDHHQEVLPVPTPVNDQENVLGVLSDNSSREGENSNSNEGLIESSPPRKFIRLRRLSGDILSVPKPVEEPVIMDNELAVTHQNDAVPDQIINENAEEVANDEEDSCPFLRIESVVSLNPDAMATDPVHELFRDLDEDPRNHSRSPEKMDSIEDVLLSNIPSTSIYSIPASSCAISSSSSLSSSSSVVESSIPVMTPSPITSKSVIKTSPEMQLFKPSTSSVPVSVLKGKGQVPQSTMRMIPVTSLPKSTITLLPSRQSMSPVKHIQLSPVKITNMKPEIAPKPASSSNIPHSLMSLSQLTRPSQTKGTFPKEKIQTSVSGKGVWCNQILPRILPKATYVRLEIKDNQIANVTNPLMLSPKSTAPLIVTTQDLQTVSVPAKTTTSSLLMAPISTTVEREQRELDKEGNVTVQGGPELEGNNTAPTIPRRGRLPAVLQTPNVPKIPASNMVLSTSAPKKSKLPHKSAVAPSYAKASKVPMVYQEMVTAVKLRHLYKCMGRLCSFTTNEATRFVEHYNEHETQARKNLSEKKRGKPPALKICDWQQCTYCCAMHTDSNSLLNHIQTEHGHCLYQCAYCFYRGVTKSYVVLHQNTSHINEHVAVLKCKEIPSCVSKPIDRTNPPSTDIVLPYICDQGTCGAIFYLSNSFSRHLEKAHPHITIYSCHMCLNKSLRPDKLLAHYKLHSCCYYQCMYCLHGTDTKEEMHHHLCNSHSNLIAKVIIRATHPSEVPGTAETNYEQNLLEKLIVLDLDEDISDEGLLILPPPDIEPPPEDPALSALALGSSVSSAELEEAFDSSSIDDQNEDDDVPDETNNITSAVSGEPLAAKSKEIDNNILDETSGNFVNSGSLERHNSYEEPEGNNSSNLRSNKKNDDEVFIIDDENTLQRRLLQQSNSNNALVQGSDSESDVVCLETGRESSSISNSRNVQGDSDVECLGGPTKERVKLNETQDSDVVVLDRNSGKRSNLQTANERAEIVDENPAKDDNEDLSRQLILPEPLVTLKHRNPETSAAIQAAVDPLSLDGSQDSFDFTSFVQNSSHDKGDAIADSTRNVRPLSSQPLISNISSIFSISEKTDSEAEIESSNINIVDITSKSNSTTAGGEVTFEDLEDRGLSGCMLYRCGYVTCTFSGKDSSLLKDHLLVCDLARASSSLNCVHCKKQFKQVTSLLEHLRTHGTRRFSCALCAFRAPVPQQVAKHLKQRHRVNNTRVEPLNPLKTDAEIDMFVVFPKEKGKGGRGGRSNAKDTQDVRSKVLFTPEEIDLLPHQAIYTRPIQCSVCCYATKVRSNMMRHLHLHKTSVTVPEAAPPSSAPVNPVPCLEAKEMFFDKMTNLAASSHMASSAKMSETPSGNLTLTEELETKLPKFVPEHQRYVCGAPQCSYLTCDETMLRYHLRALHFDETAYRCPHCPESAQENTGQVVSIERMGAHLKMHDSRLYKCAHCIYHHFQRHVVERHLADKHPEKRPFVHVVREPDMDSANMKSDMTANAVTEPGTSVPSETVKNPWRCGLCKFHCATRQEVLDHAWNVHGLKSQFKCGLCNYRSSSKASFDAHFASKHPTNPVELIHVYRKIESPQTPQSPVKSASQETNMFDTTPLWRRDMLRIRHIRGILLEEEGDVPKPDIVRRTSADVLEAEEDEEEKEEEGAFGPYGKPVGNLYFCTICKKYRSKFKADFRDHLYRELKYHKWVCTHCKLMSCNRSSLQKHSAKIHEKDRKPEAIAPLTPNKEIEEWVEKVISIQLAYMKDHASSEVSSSSSKMSGTSSSTFSLPGPSGLSSRGSKSVTPIPNTTGPSYSRTSSLIASQKDFEEDEIIISSTSSDSDSPKRKEYEVKDLTRKTNNKTTVTSSSAFGEIGKSSQKTISPFTKFKGPTGVKLLKFSCQQCSMKFSLIRSLKAHIRQAHLKSSIWTCGHCDYVTNSEESVLNHSILDHVDLPPKCLLHTKGSSIKLDDEFWEREYGLRPRAESEHTDETSITPSSSTASSPISSPMNKRQRMSSSTDEPEENVSFLSSVDSVLNKCLHCDYSCRSPSDLKYHMMRHWVQKPLRCGYCEFEGIREYEIKKHSAKVHPFKKHRVIVKPLPSQPDIRPLQRKRSKPDSLETGSDELVEKESEADVQYTEEEPKEEEQQQKIAAPIPNIFRCFYCPQRGASVVSIHQHWQEKHKNRVYGPSGMARQGLPFKYKEVNMKQFLKGQDGSGRRPSYQCSYCKARGTLAMLEVHQKNDHPDKPFQVGQGNFTRYECAECRFTAFSVNTLRRHFDVEHVGKEFRYLVLSAKEVTRVSVENNDKDSSKSVTNSPTLFLGNTVTAKYVCWWCQETCESEDKIQVHHAMCHPNQQFKYSVEKSNNVTASNSNVLLKKYSCPSCTFTSESYEALSEHLQQHARPYKCGYCPRSFETPIKAHTHILNTHPDKDYRVIKLEDPSCWKEKQLENTRSDIGIRLDSDDDHLFRSETKRESYESYPSPKRLCVARKSTTLTPRIGKFHAVARKSTNPLPFKTAKNFSSFHNREEENTSTPSSRSASPAAYQEFSFYGCRPTPVDTNRITATVKLRNDLGVSMNMTLETMEKITNMYPVVRVKDLKREKWGFL